MSTITKKLVAPVSSIDEREVLPTTNQEPELGVRAVLKTYKVHIPEEVRLGAHAELLAKQSAGGEKFTPGRESLAKNYPKTTELADWLAVQALEPSSMDLSFIRAGGPHEHIFADNLHFDARYVGNSALRGIRGTFWRPSNGVEIWRQVLNLHDQPRHLQIIDASIGELLEQGIDIYSERPVGREIAGYETIQDIPPDLLTQAIRPEQSMILEIPAYDGKNLSAIEFWSSRVLHAGITSKSGQFMAAAAKWVEPADRNQGGYYAK